MTFGEMPWKEEIEKMTFGERLWNARRHAGLTQFELAAKIGVSETVIAELEFAGRGPSLENLRRLAIALDITPDSLCGLE